VNAVSGRSLRVPRASDLFGRVRDAPGGTGYRLYDAEKVMAFLLSHAGASTWPVVELNDDDDDDDDDAAPRLTPTRRVTTLRC